MKGIDIARAYWEQYGRPAIEAQFPALLPQVAAGLCGSGSECFGYDDALSRDHDFEPGFILFLPGEDMIDRRAEFQLERLYAKLPRDFMGLHRGLVSPVGGARRGVLRAADFFRDRTGAADGILTVGQWLETPEPSLAEAVNGAIFYDGPGEVTAIRGRLQRYPQDIRLKKLAGHLLLAGQAGQYNYLRCVGHGETGAAQLAVGEFVSHAMAAAFLLCDVYRPFYKWQFRALKALPVLSGIAGDLEFLLTSGNDGNLPRQKQAVMERVSDNILVVLRAQGLSPLTDSDLERHAYAVNDRISDGDLRNAHVLAAM